LTQRTQRNAEDAEDCGKAFEQKYSTKAFNKEATKASSIAVNTGN
jgi:hypothetical protein